MQNYHPNATTNLHTRELINNNNANSSNKELSIRFAISTNTISKWRSRDFLEDKSSKPHTIKYALTDTEKALIKSIRISSWDAIDQIWETLFLVNNEISRSSVYRCLVDNKINRIPEEQKEKAKKFKEYDPGFIHIDVTYFPKFNGEANYLYVAIDRCTRHVL